MKRFYVVKICGLEIKDAMGVLKNNGILNSENYDKFHIFEYTDVLSFDLYKMKDDDKVSSIYVAHSKKLFLGGGHPYMLMTVVFKDEEEPRVGTIEQMGNFIQNVMPELYDSKNGMTKLIERIKNESPLKQYNNTCWCEL